MLQLIWRKNLFSVIIDKEAVIFQMADKPVTLEIGFVFALETKYLQSYIESLKEVRVQRIIFKKNFKICILDCINTITHSLLMS